LCFFVFFVANGPGPAAGVLDELAGECQRRPGAASPLISPRRRCVTHKFYILRRSHVLLYPNGITSYSPRVGHPRQRLSLPWVTTPFRSNPNGVASRIPTNGATPSALKILYGQYSQGSSCLTTLGFKTESRWDTNATVSKIVGNAQLRGGELDWRVRGCVSGIPSGCDRVLSVIQGCR
jgi:hypothetical protein